MSDIIQQLEKEFTKRPQWLQDAVCRLTAAGMLSADDLAQLTELCKAEAGVAPPGGAKPEFHKMPKGCLNLAEKVAMLRLDSIADVKGVNALAPRKPLEFGDAQLCVVYGGNGAGKSGYVRIIKHAARAKGAAAPHGNVFDDASAEPSCALSFTADGAKKSAQWSLKGGAIPELGGVSVYDTACADVYVNKENEVTYEPALLRLFRLLVEACGEVDKRLAAEIAAKPSSLPSMPAEFAGTDGAKWYGSLEHATKTAAVAARCAWSDADEASFTSLAHRAAEVSPVEKAKALRKTKGYAVALAARISGDSERVSDAAFDALRALRDDASAKRRAAASDAQKAFEGNLEGIASDSWRLLWSAAREYSQKEAYAGKPFPYVGEAARCVLCQRDLDEAGKARLAAFEAFVKGALEAEAVAAEKVLDAAVKRVAEGPGQEQISSMLDLAGVQDIGLRQEVASFFAAYAARREKLLGAAEKAQLPPPPSTTAHEKLAALAEKVEQLAGSLDKDAEQDQRAALKRSLAEVGARKWLAQQKAAVEAELKRLAEIYRIRQASRLTNTKWLSDTKAALAEAVVTEALVARFQGELKALRAAGIRVSIEKTKAQKGQVFHQVRIVGAKRPARAAEVLSDGQFRIVSIAAFIADVESKASVAPFIFDDPVSSLDQDFEEATAQRLVALAGTRQVIVFTHRLSMLSLLEDAAERAGVTHAVVTLRRESWGAGEPDKTGRAQDKRPDKAINVLLNDRLKRARDVLAQHGRAEYEIAAKALCSDLRITLERLVEIHLLNDVVQRFRRSVQTLNKIAGLARITATDCKLIDDFMTKYSFHEHSQPAESPVGVPEPGEIENDLKAIAVWCEEFKKRPIPVAAAQPREQLRASA